MKKIKCSCDGVWYIYIYIYAADDTASNTSSQAEDKSNEKWGSKQQDKNAVHIEVRLKLE
jgi:hypothetical protein